jgi:hypothetical protein
MTRRFLSFVAVVLLTHGAVAGRAEPGSDAGADPLAARGGKPTVRRDGSFPRRWIDGTDCQSEPDFQVHEYDADAYIIRQSMRATYEAPFF